MNAHPLAPADISNLSFTLDSAESCNGNISFTLPSTTVGMQPIANEVNISVVLDGTEFDNTTANAGDIYSKRVENLENGTHTVCVTLSCNGHAGNPAYASVFAGHDIPGAVENLTLTSMADATKALLKWDAPQKGKNGFPVDVAKLRYKVVRYPGEVIVAQSLNATEWTEDITALYGPVYYTVTPYNIDAPAMTGPATRSNTVMLGTDLNVPYYESFNTQAAFDTFTTIDVDGDGNGEWRSPCWKYDYEYYCAFYYGVKGYPANDWLITPPLRLNPNHLYRLRFKQYAYYGYGTSLRVAIGKEPTAEAMTTQLADLHTVTTFYDKPGRQEEILFAPAEGQRFIGFLHYSENMEHLSIDDISVEDVGDARVPAAPSEVTAVACGTEEVILSFKAPELTLQSKPINEKLSIAISRTADGAPVKEYSDVTPGQTLQWTDAECVTGVNNYYIVATNSYGRGLYAETSIDLSKKEPESVAMAYTRYINDKQVEITWEPSPTDDVRYLVYRIIPNQNDYIYKVIGRDIDGLRMVDDEPTVGYDETRQNYIQYYVAPVNGGGEAIATLSTGVFVGAPYSLPYSETWKEQAETAGPWARVGNGASWYIHGWAYDPMCKIPDGMGLLDLEANGSSAGSAFLYSPRIDLTTQSAPVLKFKMYHSDFYNSNVRVMVGIQKEGENNFKYTGDVFYPHTSDAAEWKECSVNLSKYADYERCSIVLVGYTVPDQRIHITDLSIEGSEDCGKVKGEYIVGDAEIHVNDKAVYQAFVKNTSKAEAANVGVDLIVNGSVVGTAVIDKIPAGDRKSASFEYMPQTAGTVILSARVKDGVNVSTTTKEVTVKNYNYPVVDDLSLTCAEENNDTKVTLKWSNAVRTAEPAEDIDGFEAYDAFTITDFGAWRLHDGDGLVPFSTSSGGTVLKWPNYDAPQAFIIFNPAKVSQYTPFGPQDGVNAAVSFGSPYGPNDDWLISPELSGDAQLISFFVRAIRTSGKENFNVLVSSTDNNPQSFVRLNGNTPLKATADWELNYFDLPQGSRYFAIQYVGEKQDGIVVDDVRFDGYFSTIRPDSYNVYRNSSLIGTCDKSTTTFEYVDKTAAADAVYTVRPVFNGHEGSDSNEVSISSSGIIGTTLTQQSIITASHGTITVCNALNDVEVYSVDGRLIAQAPAAEKAVINIAPGIYLVRCGDIVAKLLVK